MHSTPPAAHAGRMVFVGHTSVLSGAELSLLAEVPQIDGALVLLFEDGPLVRALLERGVNVRLVGTSAKLSGVHRESGLLTALRTLPGVVRLAREVLRLTGPADVICANSQKSWVIVALAACVKRRTVVWRLHDILSREHFNRTLFGISIALANRLAAAVIVNSAATGESFVEHGGRADLVRLVYPGIDAAPFAAISQAEIAALRRELNLEGAVSVGLFGRLSSWKGQHVLLAALQALPRVRALIVGAPLFGEDAYLRELEEQAADPALAGRVTFLGFRHDIPALMHAVDIVVHASTAAEPFGRVVVEAMLARKPVIATALGGIREIVNDGSDGLLVPPGDAAALARAIATLADGPALREQLAAAGQRTAARRFSLEESVTGMLAVIDQAGAARARVTSL